MKRLIKNIGQLFGALLRPFTDRAQHQPVNYINIKTLVLHLCDFDEDLCLWVMRWLAYPMRNPGAKMSRALVVAGPEGTGKSLLFERIMSLLYGDGSVRAEHAPIQTTCSWSIGTRLVVFSGRLQMADVTLLKHLITAPDIWHTQPYRTAIKGRNRANLVFLTGAAAPLLIERSTRRFCVVRAPAPMPAAFYRSVVHEIENGGIEAFRGYLMRDLDMGGFDEMAPPPIGNRCASLMVA